MNIPAFDKFGIGTPDINITNRSLDKNFDALRGFVKMSTIGSVDGSDAAAGEIGEYIENANNTGSISLATGTPINVAGFTLTPGDWEIRGSLDITPAAGATPTAIIASLSTVANSLSSSFYSQTQLVTSFTIGNRQIISTPIVRHKSTLSVPWYLVAYVNFTGGTCTAGGVIHARRIR